MKPLMLPEGWISCLGRILMLGVDSLWRGSSEKPGQEILKTYTSKMRFTTEDGISPVCASASSPSLYVNCRSNATLCKDSQTSSAAVATVHSLSASFSCQDRLCSLSSAQAIIPFSPFLAVFCQCLREDPSFM